MRNEVKSITNSFSNTDVNSHVNRTYLALGIFHSHTEQVVFRGIELLDSFSRHERQDYE